MRLFQTIQTILKRRSEATYTLLLLRFFQPLADVLLESTQLSYVCVRLGPIGLSCGPLTLHWS